MTRQRLANRRVSEFLEFESLGMRFTASASRYSDGRLGDHKAGSAIGTLVRDSAIILSFALQPWRRHQRDRQGAGTR
jgi:hypothetical protein